MPLPEANGLYAGALELEKRLYESSVAAVEQTFAKEGLVITFLSSGAIVSFASGLQSFASALQPLPRAGIYVGTAFLALALISLGVSLVKSAGILRGRQVTDVSDAETLLNLVPEEATHQQVLLQLMAEYKQARLNHVKLVEDRMTALFRALRWLAISMGLSFLAILIAFTWIGASKSEEVRHLQPYTSSVSESTTQNTGSGTRVTLPPAGPGTTMTKGGGGVRSGARTPASTSTPQPAPSSNPSSTRR